MERLNKYLAHAGVGSRRHCDSLIAAGRVKLNGKVVVDLGTRVDPVVQKVSVDDQPVHAEKPVYWVVNKPPGYLCTNHDPSGRPLASDLIPHVEQRVYTVGRLDESSEGMLLMTNDGELANSLMHPRYEIEKTYLVLVAGKPTTTDLQTLLDGIWLSDGKVKAKSVKRIRSQGESTWLRIVLCEGKNREIRRMLAKLSHKVLQLKRIAIGPIQIDRLPKGKARKLTVVELEELRKAIAKNLKRIEDRVEEHKAPERKPTPRPAPRPMVEEETIAPRPIPRRNPKPVAKTMPFAKPTPKPFEKPKPNGKPVAKGKPPFGPSKKYDDKPAQPVKASPGANGRGASAAAKPAGRSARPGGKPSRSRREK
jgi:23S rRNA pseudouridine2605 synthase